MGWKRERRLHGRHPWIGIPKNHVRINAEAEVTDPASVWSFYHKLIELRKATPVIQKGSVRFLDALSDKAIVYERVLEDAAAGPKQLIVCCNFSGKDQAVLSERQSRACPLRLELR